MNLLYVITLVVNLLVGLVFGVTVSEFSKKSNPEGPTINRVLGTYSIIAIGIGVVFGVLTQDVFTSVQFKTISDILVSLFGFSGLIFTFLIGNILRNESDLVKHIGDYEIKRDEALLAHGTYISDKYQVKIDDFVQSLAICKNNFKRAMVLGLSSIAFFFVSLLCVILESYYALIFKSGLILNVWLFSTMFLGFTYLFLSLAYIGRT